MLKLKDVLKKVTLNTALMLGIFVGNNLNANPENNKLVLPQSNVFIPSSLGNISLLHDNENFYILEEDGSYTTIQNCFIDKELRNCSVEQLQRLLGNTKEIELFGQKITMHKIPQETFDQLRTSAAIEHILELDSETLDSLSSSSYIKVTKLSSGEFSLKLTSRLLGGGPGGAVVGAWVGKFVASAICHGAICVVGGVVSLVATPTIGGIVATSLETTLAGPIESFTTAAALAASITGAVVTGPA